MEYKTIEVGEKIILGCPEIKRILGEAADNPFIILNFAKVKEMDTTGIEMILNLYKKALKNKGDLKCSNVKESILDILILTGLNKIIDLGIGELS